MAADGFVDCTGQGAHGRVYRGGPALDCPKETLRKNFGVGQQGRNMLPHPYQKAFEPIADTVHAGLELRLGRFAVFAKNHHFAPGHSRTLRWTK